MLSGPSFFAASCRRFSRSAPVMEAEICAGSFDWAAAGSASAAATSAGISSRERRFMSVGFLFDFLPLQEEVGPDLLPLLVLVEGDDRVDHLEGELVEMGVHGEAGGHAV